MLRRVVSLSLALMLPAVAQANVIYTYTGNNFDNIQDLTPPAGTYTTDMRVTGTFELAAPFLPNLVNADLSDEILSFSISDGRRTLTNNTLGIQGFFGGVATDSSGDIIEWQVQYNDDLDPIVNVGDDGSAIFTISVLSLTTIDGGQLQECIAVGCLPVDQNVDFGRRDESPGTWTLIPGPIPEPHAVLLFATGVATVAVTVRRRARVR